jgi:DNA repair protein RecN (Recombination protein N)
LASEDDILGDAEAHREALGAAYDALEGPAGDALGDAVAHLTGRAPFEALAERLRALQAEIADAAHDVRVAREEIVADPERLAFVHERRALLQELMRKYGPTLDDVLRYGRDSGARLADLEQHDERSAALAARRGEALTAARAAAADLTRIRRKAAPRLAAEVAGHLRELAMPKAVFEVSVAPADLSDDGADEVVFLLAANPGEPARPLARTASGGELSRAMLALRVVLTEAPPTLVFDEVDAGIGGETGTAVGRALAGLGGVHQVLCVTHLAQVAAHADAQIAVAKSEVDGRTVASATLLLDDTRVAELSRMLGGDGSSPVAREHARELLDHADAARAEARAR